MSETEPNPGSASQPVRRSRWRRFFMRHLPLSMGVVVLTTALAVVGFYIWASSEAFQNVVRGRIVAWLERSTGGRVEMASFHWNILNLEAEAGGLVIHGLESPAEAPYARVDRLRLRISILDLFSPRVLLRDLVISHPGFHLIVYSDGSTNQPHPRRVRKPGKSGLDTVFDLQAGHIAVEQGVLEYEDRASSFDYQDRYIPLDFEANDVSAIFSYIGASGASPESFHIEAGANDLELARGGPKSRIPTVHGRIQATMDLERNGASLRSLRVTAFEGAGKQHTLEISGGIQDFAHPRWEVKTAGELDMALLDPLFGYPMAPAGMARLDLASSGVGGEFLADGSIHVEGGSYIGTGVVAAGIGLDAHIHADPRQLVITQVVARLRQGGRMEGSVNLSPWLPGDDAAEVTLPDDGHVHTAAERDRAPVRPGPSVIPVNGTVKAELRNVPLDAILDMVSERPFQRLGLDAVLNGPAVATWTKGDSDNVVATTALTLTPSSKPLAGEAPVTGLIDATYTQHSGAAMVRQLAINMPESQLLVHGQVGAHPLSSPSNFGVEFHSTNLGEFDTVLRDLGLTRYGRSGAAALPIGLKGQADFKGSWNGSLVDPHLSGEAKATEVSLELLPVTVKTGQTPEQPNFMSWDTIEASGSYSGERIAIDNGRLVRGKTSIELAGSLDATVIHGKEAEFDGDSVLHAHLRATRLGVDDLSNLTGSHLPMAGVLDAQVEADGLVRAPNGSGWVEMNGGTVYGEAVDRLRAQGSLEGQQVRLSSLTASGAGGTLSASGSYNWQDGTFKVDGKGAAIDLARIHWFSAQGVPAAGKLAFTLTGSGTMDDPRLEAHATLGSLALDRESLGAVVVAAHTANRTAFYNATTRLEGAEVDLTGQTALKGDYATQATVQFSQFDIGPLLEQAHVAGLSGESALAGTVTLAGPLAKPDQLRGEARLRELAATVAGVHLKSEGGVHATLADGRMRLDPLHVTGEDTDLRAEGSLMIKGTQQLDLAASGSINLKLAETLDQDLTASGTTTFQVEAHGPLKNPDLQGRVDFQNGSLALEDIPNGLSQIHGTLEFSQNRLEVKALTAMSGGGLLSVGGYLAYQHGLFADLSVTGKQIRIRYPEGVSSLADATFTLQGTQNNLLLGGNVLITRFSVSPDLDIAALAAQANTVQTIAPADAPSNHIRLDVHLASSPQLNFQNAYAKLAGDIDLRLRGTLASPSLLGRVSITEGNAIIAGTRYDLQRGDISFTNPVRIEPSIDLNATARVEDYDITLGLHGTPSKLDVTYRSDPPLPEADVVALLALGRTENQQRLYTQQQEQALSNPTTDALLGGALNATVSSRVQKLFGAGSVKVDPNYLGALGNSTSRIIVEEQLGRNVTLTYATNVSTTGQQLLQAEVAINRHVSLLVARDESGVFSMVLKATRRYR